MSDARAQLAPRAAELRQAFDRSFTEARQFAAMPSEGLLAIRLGSEPHAIRLSAVAGLHKDRKITRVPGGIAALLGIAGLRGAILPVYDLRILLGYPADDVPRWLIAASATPVGFAFDHFEGQLRLSPQEIKPREAGGSSRSPVREFAYAQDRTWPIVDLAAVLDVIRDQPRDAAPSGEGGP